MHRCYAPGACLKAGASLDIEGEEARHALKVLRLRVGDECEVFNGCGQAAIGRIAATSGSSFSATHAPGGGDYPGPCHS